MEAPGWVAPYRPKYLKRPKDGRVFQVPRKKQAMRDARAILLRLRRECGGMDERDRLAYMLAVLREICPFRFEELLLHSFGDMGWRVERSCFTHDGGVDGAMFDAEGYRWPIQAKRYREEIDPLHVLDFSEVVERERAVSGLFIHTGVTCEDSALIAAHAGNVLIWSDALLMDLVLQ